MFCCALTSFLLRSTLWARTRLLERLERSEAPPDSSALLGSCNPGIHLALPEDCELCFQASCSAYFTMEQLMKEFGLVIDQI